MAAVAANNAAAAATNKQPTFEFTRRKRWADLLVNELAEAIVLVLNPVGKILFCGPAVTELLGWRDEELIDGDLLELINAEDQPSFRQTLAGAIHAHTDLLAYVRLRSKSLAAVNASASTAHAVARHAHDLVGDYGYAIPTAGPSSSVAPQPPPLALGAAPAGPAAHPQPPKEVLFEVTGYPHFVDPDEMEDHGTLGQRHGHPQCKVVFAIAKPYPSRNTAMLNTFLELKIENERLQRRLTDLRSKPAGSRLAVRAPPYAQPQQHHQQHPQQRPQHPQPRSPSLTPVLPHPYAGGVPPSPAQATPTDASAFGSVPVSMSMQVSSLAGAGYAPPAPPPSQSAFAAPVPVPQQQPQPPSAASFYGAAGYAEYATATGNDGNGAYGFPPTSSGLAALSMASNLTNGNGSNGNSANADVHRRMSLSHPQALASATSHRRGSLPDGGGAGARDRNSPELDVGADGGKKKKARRHAGEQFVCRTCGRTDSPEWRKGPLGPKTLCNACGLRWAKQVRKGEDKDEPGVMAAAVAAAGGAD